MTPQQMHIEAAKKVIHELLDDPSAISIRGILTPMIALALAAAENRAAWDGFQCGCDYTDAIECGKAISANRIECDLGAKYGPREVTNG